MFRAIDIDIRESPNTDPDFAIVQACLQGDPHGFKKLYQRHQHKVRSTLYQLCGSDGLDEGGGKRSYGKSHEKLSRSLNSLTFPASKATGFLIQRDNLPDRLASTWQRSNSPQALIWVCPTLLKPRAKIFSAAL